MSEEMVKALAEQVDRDGEVELEVLLSRRDRELLAYLRHAYDREARLREVCGWPLADETFCQVRGPWATITDLMAHVRVHLIFDCGDVKTVRSVLKDIDEIAHPKEQLAVKVAARGVDRARLIRQVGAGLTRQLAAPLDKALPAAVSELLEPLSAPVETPTHEPSGPGLEPDEK